jgi:hypothetical protein
VIWSDASIVALWYLKVDYKNGEQYSRIVQFQRIGGRSSKKTLYSLSKVSNYTKNKNPIGTAYIQVISMKDLLLKMPLLYSRKIIKIENIIVVADRGMPSKDNIDIVQNQNN